jgi:hypothetical protein
MAIANVMVSEVTAVATAVLGSTSKEFPAATPMKPSANQGMTVRLDCRVPLPN